MPLPTTDNPPPRFICGVAMFVWMSLGAVMFYWVCTAGVWNRSLIAFSAFLFCEWMAYVASELYIARCCIEALELDKRNRQAHKDYLTHPCEEID